MNPQVKMLIEQHYLDVIRTKNVKGLEDGCYVVRPEKLEQYTLAVIEQCIKLFAPSEHHRAYAEDYVCGCEGLELLDACIRDVKRYWEIK